MRNRCFRALAVMFLAGAVLGGTQPARAGIDDIRDLEQLHLLELSYIPSDCCAIWITHPQRIEKSPLVAPFLEGGEDPDIEPIPLALLARMPDIEHLDVGIAQFVAAVSPATAEVKGPNEIPFVPVLILRFAEAVDGKKLMGTMFPRNIEDMKEVSHAGKTYYADPDAEMAVYLPDDRTMVISVEKMLQKIITAKQSSGPLLDRLRGVDARHDVIGVVVLDPLRELIEEGAADVRRGLPPELAEVADAPKYAEAAMLTIDFTGEKMIGLTVEARNAKSAVELEGLVKKGRDGLSNLYTDYREEMLKDMPPTLAGPFEVLVAELFRGFSIDRKDDRVLLGMKRPPSLEDFVRKLVAEMRRIE
ncbi:MAG TPA: hypothetical protein VMY42_26760 [Thermoguttaceae bacterium]|nr:hypothetical protein [Thermoguttaceae bacterium]